MKEFDLIIIGAGPAGYVAAIRAGQLGMNIALVEKEKLGGMCLNWGCMPSKSLLESAKLYGAILKAGTFGIDGIDRKALSFNWKKAVGRKDRIVMRLVKGVEFLMKKNKIEVLTGVAKLTAKNTITIGDEQYSAKSILIATGSRPGTDALKAVDSKKVLQIDEFFDTQEMDDKYLVYGSSPYACETAFMLRLIGKEVTIVTPDKKLMELFDTDVSKFVQDKFTKIGIKIHTESAITKDAVDGVNVGEAFVACQKVINCSDRNPVLPEMDIELEVNGSSIIVNDYMQTSVDSIYAAGDVTGQYLAHIGSAQGVVAVNHIAGIKESIDYQRLPQNVYLSPEIATVGLTEQEIESSGQEYSKGIFPMSINGKAMAEGSSEGFVKVLAEKKYGEVLGVHIVAPHATDMIAEAVTIMQLEATLEDVGRIVHAHPTVSESIVEASLIASGMPRHA